MAADSQATETAGNVRHPTDKLFQLTPRSVWGAAGGAQIARDLQRQLPEAATAIDASADPAQLITNEVRKVLLQHYTPYLPQVPGIPIASPATSVLACGLGPGDAPWIIEVDPHCAMSHYEDLGFHAIGSGAGFAQLASALMAHFDVRLRPVRHGLLLAYRVMDAAIDISSYGLGKPIQIWAVTPGGRRRLPKEELDEIEANVGGWRELERQTLDELMGAKSDQLPEMPPVDN
jgi:hypothetical protein